MARCDVPRRECYADHTLPHLDRPRASSATSSRSHCPAHPDAEPSLSVSVGEQQRIVWHCHAGCDELAVRDGLIRLGVHPDCLTISRARERSLVDEITALYEAKPALGNAEIRWRVYSLVKGHGGEMPARGRYEGGRRKFAGDAGVSRTDLYGRDR